MDENVKVAKSDDDVTMMRQSAKWLAIAGAVFLGFLYVYWLGWNLRYDQAITQTFYEHLRAVLGIPGSIITAFVLVSVLEQVSGPIEIEVLAFKLNGAAGPVILWIVCFLSMVLGIKVLW
jgi:hypothetical protein